jgi:hypothetical protein
VPCKSLSLSLSLYLSLSLSPSLSPSLCAARRDTLCRCPESLVGNGTGPAGCAPCPDGAVKNGTRCVPTGFSFAATLAAAGNRSAALALARGPWAPANVSLAQSAQALAAALIAAGLRFGAPCTASVPFLAVPGLMLSTVPGAVYQVYIYIIML